MCLNYITRVLLAVVVSHVNLPCRSPQVVTWNFFLKSDGVLVNAGGISIDAVILSLMKTLMPFFSGCEQLSAIY